LKKQSKPKSVKKWKISTREQLIKQYARKGYSANRIQKKLQKQKLGMRRAVLLAKVREYKRVPKRQVKRKEKPPVKVEKKPEIEKLNFLYDLRIRVAYISKKPNHTRVGSIACIIISKEPLTNDRIINICVDYLINNYGKETWAKYVPPNKHTLIYIHSDYTKEQIFGNYEVRSFKFEEVR